ncbi:MarR family winged helix-turn-helix transcriptional regulator [Rhizobium sp. BE258]|uniref:MarR family winged helix-turn-helix transcriptional regulator n=1 Tax=Rhizobium sp. BE258 TaxID=2817722 RepID=UPI0028551F14|nr:MarR family winged helix-turn-helix transcriptional regulator [Rhizobium sp. BE258]MDR7142974.1 DNA-binding MarR family transcriptional regulator [Rhizobium sp. BE258]
MPKESLSEIEYEALANLRYRIRKFRQFSADAATRLGLAPPEHQALLAIKGLGIDGEMSVSSLAETLFLAPAAAMELTEGLRDRGFLTIATKPKHRIVVRLTDQAEELLRRLTPAHLYEIREMAPELMQALRALQDHRRMEMAAWMQ